MELYKVIGEYNYNLQRNGFSINFPEEMRNLLKIGDKIEIYPVNQERRSLYFNSFSVIWTGGDVIFSFHFERAMFGNRATSSTNYTTIHLSQRGATFDGTESRPIYTASGVEIPFKILVSRLTDSPSFAPFCGTASEKLHKVERFLELTTKKVN